MRARLLEKLDRFFNHPVTSTFVIIAAANSIYEFFNKSSSDLDKANDSILKDKAHYVRHRKEIKRFLLSSGDFSNDTIEVSTMEEISQLLTRQWLLGAKVDVCVRWRPSTWSLSSTQKREHVDIRFRSNSLTPSGTLYNATQLFSSCSQNTPSSFATCVKSNSKGIEQVLNVWQVDDASSTVFDEKA